MSFKNTPITLTKNINGTDITLETGLLARQATSSVLAKMGETTVLAAVVVGDDSGSDYFPLQVVYEERLYASGKLKDSLYNKREGKPTDRAVLVGRMVDRSLRSLFDPDIRTAIQVVLTVLSVDKVNPPDIVAILAASSALSLIDFEDKKKEGLINLEQDLEIEFNEKEQKYNFKNNLVLGGELIENNPENEEIKAFVKSQIEEGSDITTNPELVKEMEGEGEITEQLYFGPVSAVRVGLANPKTKNKELTENYLKVLKSVKSLKELQAVEEALSEAVEIIQDQGEIAKLTRLLGKNNPSLAIYFKDNILSKADFNKKNVGEPVLQFNPSYEELEQSKLNLVISGTEKDIVMIEAEGEEVEEETVAIALEEAMSPIQELNELQREFRTKCQNLS